ncbi:hypothetical protein, partial [Chromobacterium piscinae]|uniref:hypothetical protein n=1 Tax=Chromobacterium piscinae TaxID=686831 RepID=UPI0032613E26
MINIAMIITISSRISNSGRERAPFNKEVNTVIHPENQTLNAPFTRENSKRNPARQGLAGGSLP